MTDGQRIVDRLGGAIHRTLSQHCPDCEEQAGVIVGLRNHLGFVLDREADTQRHHNAKIEAQAAEIEKLRGAVDALLQHEASTFFGPDAEKYVRASWRGVIRKARAALRETK